MAGLGPAAAAAAELVPRKKTQKMSDSCRTAGEHEVNAHAGEKKKRRKKKKKRREKK